METGGCSRIWMARSPAPGFGIIKQMILSITQSNSSHCDSPSLGTRFFFQRRLHQSTDSMRFVLSTPLLLAVGVLARLPPIKGLRGPEPDKPVPEGTTDQCTYYFNTAEGNDCQYVEDYWGLTHDQFVRWVCFTLNGTPLSLHC